MATCGIGAGMTFSCDDKQDAAGGLKQDFYVANVGEIDSLSFDGNGYVSSINFEAYKGLYKFKGVKAKSTAGSDIQRGEGGIAYYPHEVNATLLDITPAQKEVLEDLAGSETVWILPTSTGRYEMYGWPLGLEITAGPRNSGETSQANASRLVTLSGDQPFLEKVVLMDDGVASTLGEESTKAVLETYVV